jgi:plasmid stabilization system protein ParE
MSRFRLSPQAELDIELILAWTDQRFGEKPPLRSEALIVRAFWTWLTSRNGQVVSTDPRSPLL